MFVCLRAVACTFGCVHLVLHWFVCAVMCVVMCLCVFVAHVLACLCVR